MKTQDRTIKELLDNFDLFFRIEDDGSIHLKDYKNGKYAIYDWIVDSLYKVSELKQPEKQEIEIAEDSKTKVRNLLIEAREILIEIDKHYTTTAYEPDYIIGTHDIEIAKILQQEAVNKLLKE